MTDATPVEPIAAATDTGLDPELANINLDGGAPITPEQGVTPVESTSTPTEPVTPTTSVEPVEPVQKVEPIVSVEPVTPVESNPMVSAAEIMGNNTELLSQIQSMMAPQINLNPSQTPVESTALQPGTNGEQSAPQFDEAIVNNLLENPQAFVEHLAAVISDNIYQAAPSMIQQELATSQRTQERYTSMATDFYAVNKDLAEHRPLVQSVAHQVSQQYPSLNEQQLLALTANMVRNHIGKVQVNEQSLPPSTVTQLNNTGTPGTNNVVELTPEQEDFDLTLQYAENNRINL